MGLKFNNGKGRFRITSYNVCYTKLLRFIDYHKYNKPLFVYIVFLGSLLMLGYTSFLGIDHNGARRWLKIGLEFQP